MLWAFEVWASSNLKLDNTSGLSVGGFGVEVLDLSLRNLKQPEVPKAQVPNPKLQTLGPSDPEHLIEAAEAVGNSDVEHQVARSV